MEDATCQFLLRRQPSLVRQKTLAMMIACQEQRSTRLIQCMHRVLAFRYHWSPSRSSRQVSVLRSQRHDNVRRCGLVQLEIGPAVVAPAGKFDDFCALGCRLGGLDRLHDVESVLVKEERVIAEQVVEFCNQGVFVGNNARFELIQGSLDLRRVEFHRALLFQVCSKASPRDIASCGPPTSMWLNATYALCVVGQVTTIELNEPVAPEFRNILPDELFQTVEIVPILETCLSTCHAFSFHMPTLSTCHTPALISRNYWDQRELWANHVLNNSIPRS